MDFLGTIGSLSSSRPGILFMLGLLVVVCCFLPIAALWPSKADNAVLYKRLSALFRSRTSFPEVMLDLQPCSQFDYREEPPLRVYKFAPKYHMTMGLQFTSMSHIAHIDRTYAMRIKLRRELASSRPEILGCLPEGEPVVRELYTYLVREWLARRYPTIFKLDTQTMHLQNRVTGDSMPLNAPEDPKEALRYLNANLDDDFLMLVPSFKPDAEGETWDLKALVWAFPNHSDPKIQLGRSLRELHGPVPGYKAKIERSMNRFFGKLGVGQAVCRASWAVSIKASQNASQLVDEAFSQTSVANLDISQVFVRSELQTLFALPETGARILSIHEYLYPLQEIKDEGNGPAMAAAIDGLKEGNVPSIWNYKDADVWAESVKRFLLAD